MQSQRSSSIVEFAHRCRTKLVFGQELWLVGLHEFKKPVATTSLFFVRLFRELLLSVLHDGILLRDDDGETGSNYEKCRKFSNSYVISVS
jgi:hypothetical protein